MANTQHFRASARACPASHAQFSQRTAILRVVILRSRRKAPCSSARSRSLLAFARHVRYAERSASRSKRRWAMPFTTFISILTTLFSTANWLAMLMTCNSRILALGDGCGGKERAVLPALVIRVGTLSRFPVWSSTSGNRETQNYDIIVYTVTVPRIRKIPVQKLTRTRFARSKGGQRAGSGAQICRLRTRSTRRNFQQSKSPPARRVHVARSVCVRMG